MEKNIAAPVVKWAGGKRQLLSALLPLLPQTYSAYCEPFVGGGAMLLRLRPETAIINDVNPELINLYRVIRDDVEGLIAALEEHCNEAAHFYAVRAWDRDKKMYGSLSPVQRAARILYLNKTCYNGLFRVNSEGQFNTPFGHYKNPNLVNAPQLSAVSGYFNSARIEFLCGDYEEALRRVPAGAFVYLDPPYDPVSATANFTGYTKGGFGRQEQIRLRQCCDELDARGVSFMLSNSATDFIRQQYSAYHIAVVRAKRAINSVSSGRGHVDEVVIRNYA